MLQCIFHIHLHVLYDDGALRYKTPEQILHIDRPVARI